MFCMSCFDPIIKHTHTQIPERGNNTCTFIDEVDSREVDLTATFFLVQSPQRERKYSLAVTLCMYFFLNATALIFMGTKRAKGWIETWEWRKCLKEIYMKRKEKEWKKIQNKEKLMHELESNFFIGSA